MHRNRGFTLLELLVTVAIVAILVTVGIPSFIDTIRNNRLVTQTNTFLTALNLARAEAVKRGVRVTVCKKSSSTNSCDTADNSIWDNGWIVFVESNSSGTNGAIDTNEETLQIGTALTGGNTLRVGNSFKKYVSFLPTGQTAGSGGNQDKFRLCDARGAEKGRFIAITLTGRSRARKYETSDDTCP